jgi:hypothetical protein
MEQTMSTAGISAGQPRVGITLTDMKNDFSKAADSQHLRFSDAKGLHTHAKYGSSMVDFLAKFRNADALQARADLRQGAVDKVKTAIDNEYGKGMGDRVFARAAERGEDYSHGITKGDLTSMTNFADELRAGDLDKANARLGNQDISDVMKAAMDAGVEHGHLDQDGMRSVRFAIADAVNALPQGTSSADAQRAALGAAIGKEMFRLAEQYTAARPELNKAGYNKGETAAFQAALNTFFAPGGANAGVDASTARSILVSYAGRCSAPSADNIVKDVARDRASNATLQQKGAEIRDFIKDMVDPGGKGLTDGAIQSFMRGNPSTPTEPGFAAYAMVRSLAAPGLAGPIGQAVQRLGSLETFEYRSLQLEKFDGAKQAKVAGESLRAFEDVMTLIFGGKSDSEINTAVAKLPQDFCDLLATAHHSLDANVTISDEIPSADHDATKADLHKKLDVNFLTLRVINPLFTEQIAQNPKLVGAITGATKLIQDAANGIASSSKGKEQVHASLGDSLNTSIMAWSTVHDSFMAKAAARGHVIV